MAMSINTNVVSINAQRNLSLVRRLAGYVDAAPVLGFACQ